MERPVSRFPTICAKTKVLNFLEVLGLLATTQPLVSYYSWCCGARFLHEHGEVTIVQVFTCTV